MGILIFQRGWALHDRQTALFGSLPRPFSFTPYDQTIEFYREIDNRIGYYVGADYKIGSHIVRALHYDNRGDPSAHSGKESAWLSRFDALGWRYEMPTDTTFIVQGLKGNMAVGPSADGRGMLSADFGPISHSRVNSIANIGSRRARIACASNPLAERVYSTAIKPRSLGRLHICWI